jgi:hypothetical protein
MTSGEPKRSYNPGLRQQSSRRSLNQLHIKCGTIVGIFLAMYDTGGLPETRHDQHLVYSK